MAMLLPLTQLQQFTAEYKCKYKQHVLAHMFMVSPVTVDQLLSGSGPLLHLACPASTIMKL